MPWIESMLNEHCSMIRKYMYKYNKSRDQQDASGCTNMCHCANITYSNVEICLSALNQTELNYNWQQRFRRMLLHFIIWSLSLNLYKVCILVVWYYSCVSMRILKKIFPTFRSSGIFFRCRIVQCHIHIHSFDKKFFAWFFFNSQHSNKHLSGLSLI